MNLQHVRTFVTVAELGTVSKAAMRLRVAQPALSRQIGSLEQELGLMLFDRVGRRLVLTGAGEQLLAECRSLLSYATGIGEHAQQLSLGDTGILKVAASPQVIESVLSGFLHRFSARFPNVQVRLIEAIAWSDTLGMLERGEIHFGQNLLRAVRPGNPRLASLPLEMIELLAACHAPLKLGKGGAIEIADVAAHPLLILDSSFVSRRTFDATCRLAGVEPNIVFESRTPHTVLAMAERAHGVAIVPSAVRVDRYQLRITRVTYQGKALREPLAIFWDKRRPLPSYAAAFRAMLAAYAREVFPISQPSEPRRRAMAQGTAPSRRPARAEPRPPSRPSR